MQANVDQILTSARTTGRFRLVTGDAPHELGGGDCPALIVYRRELVNIEPHTTNRLYYVGDWQYQVWIESPFKSGHAVVETLLRAFLAQLAEDMTDPWFELVDRIVIDEGYHAQRQIIAAQFTLSIPSHYDLE